MKSVYRPHVYQQFAIEFIKNKEKEWWKLFLDIWKEWLKRYLEKEGLIS